MIKGDKNMNNKWFQDTEGNTSGKRVFGGIAMVIFILAAVGISVYSVSSGNDIGSNSAGLLNSVGWVGCTLLGIGVAERFGKK